MRDRVLLPGQDGQVLVLVALGAVVLLGALAFGIDWGYALTQRRAAQNIVDAAALGAGKYLATTIISIDGTPAFSVTQQKVWCAAKAFDAPNRAFAPGSATRTFDVYFGSAADPSGTKGAQPPSCPATGGATIPANTIYLRLVTQVSYRALVTSVLGQSTITAAASARVRLSGTPVPDTGPVWPMVRHYDPKEFVIQCPTATCDPTQVEPLTFWSPNADQVVYGNFKGLVDYSRHSSRFSPTLADQLLTDWDRTGSAQASPPTPLKTDRSGNCGGLWDTAGGEDPQNQDKQCSIPNWYYYTFLGRLTLDSAWGASLPSGQEAPSPLTPRSLCAAPPDPAPSCGNNSLGDWVETAFGNVGQNMSDNMRALIAQRGRVMPYSDKTVPSGPNKGSSYGKGAVILVFLWDCAETFTSTAPAGDQWSLIVPTTGPNAGDCSQLAAGGTTPTPHRVHLFTIAPFTFYEGLVSAQAIQGYWGGAFGNPDACQSCVLNTLANTVILVPDQ